MYLHWGVASGVHVRLYSSPMDGLGKDSFININGLVKIRQPISMSHTSNACLHIPDLVVPTHF